MCTGNSNTKILMQKKYTYITGSWLLDDWRRLYLHVTRHPLDPVVEVARRLQFWEFEIFEKSHWSFKCILPKNLVIFPFAMICWSFGFWVLTLTLQCKLQISQKTEGRSSNKNQLLYFSFGPPGICLGPHDGNQYKLIIIWNAHTVPFTVLIWRFCCCGGSNF